MVKSYRSICPPAGAHSHGGHDFAAIGAALAEGGYRFGAIMIDAAFSHNPARGFSSWPRNNRTPFPSGCSRPVRTIIGTRRRYPRPTASFPSDPSAWLWWRLPPPPIRNVAFSDIIDAEPYAVKWHAPQTRRLLAMMSPINYAKVVEAKKAGRRIVGGVYKRMRAKRAAERFSAPRFALTILRAVCHSQQADQADKPS